MFWQPATHAPDVVFTRYRRRPVFDSLRVTPDHRLLLDGKFTGYRGSVDELKSIVEWIIAGRIIARVRATECSGQTEPTIGPQERSRGLALRVLLKEGRNPQPG